MKDTLLLFDLDGTLWDSAAPVAEAWNEVFQRECPGLPLLTNDDIHSVPTGKFPAGMRSLISAAFMRWSISIPIAAPSIRISVPPWKA